MSKYHDLDFDSYEYLPFVVETCEGIGDAAKAFCKELKKRRMSKSSFECSYHDRQSYQQQDVLLTSINVEIQRFNSQMILERNPVTEHLIESKMVKCAIAIARRKKQAREVLDKNNLREQVIKASYPVGDISLKSAKDLAPAEAELLCSGSMIGNRMDYEDVLQQTTSHMQQSLDPPPPREEQDSSHAPHDINRRSSALEHSLATKTKNNSRMVSTSVQASVSILSTDPYTCDDWRRSQNNTGVQTSWEPPLQERNGEMRGPLLIPTYTKNSTQSHKMGPKLIAKRGLLGNCGKMADAREWEPPKHD